MDYWQLAAVGLKCVLYLATLLAAGSFLFRLFGGERQQDFGLVRLIENSSIAGIIISLLYFLIEVAILADNGFAGLFNMDIIRLLAGSPLGMATIFRLLGFMMLLGGAGITALAAMGSVLVTFGTCIAGHANDGSGYWLQLLLLVHLLAIAFWLGMLWPLYRACALLSLCRAAELARRFGRFAQYTATLVVMAGFTFIAVLIEQPLQLLDTSYGRLLLGKLLLVGLLLFVAAYNKLRLVPAMLAGEKLAAATLRRMIIFEALAMLLILLIMAVLTSVVDLPS